MRLLLLSCLFLSACASERIVYRDVRVPVPVPCSASVGDDPQYADAPSAIQSVSDVYELAKLLLAGRAQRDARIVELKGAVAGCR